MLNYAAAVALAILQPQTFNTVVMAPAHAVLGIALAYQTMKLHADNYSQAGIAAFYRFIWNLFYLEYALLPWL